MDDFEFEARWLFRKDVDARGRGTRGVDSVFIVGNGVVDDDTTCDGDGGDLHQRVALTTGPRLEVERRESIYFVRIVNAMCWTANEDAPAFTEGLIDAIDLESDDELLLDKIGLGHIGAEDDLSRRELEVDGQCNGPSFGREDDAAYPTSSQIRVTLVPRQSYERGMAACSSPSQERGRRRRRQERLGSYPGRARRDSGFQHSDVRRHSARST